MGNNGNHQLSLNNRGAKRPQACHDGGNFARDFGKIVKCAKVFTEGRLLHLMPGFTIQPRRRLHLCCLAAAN